MIVLTSGVVSLFESGFKFRVDSMWIDWERKNIEQFTKKQVAFICLHNKSEQTDIIHPLTDFIFSYWRFSAYNTQRKNALNTTMFLNFILEKRHQFHVFSLNELEIVHGDLFLNSLTKSGFNRQTIKDVERTLGLFFRYLTEKDCLPKVNPLVFEKIVDTTGKTTFLSPFKNVMYPSETISPIEHTFPLKYLPLLFEIAILVANPIALGLYLQIFGGLRVGEVVNTKRTSIRHRLCRRSLSLSERERFFLAKSGGNSGQWLSGVAVGETDSHCPQER